MTTTLCECVGGPADGLRYEFRDDCETLGVPIGLGGHNFAQATYRRREAERTLLDWVETRYPEIQP